MRQVAGIAEQAPLLFRVLVENINRPAQNFIHAARKQPFQLTQRLHGRWVHVNDIEIAVRHQNAHRGVFHHLLQP